MKDEKSAQLERVLGEVAPWCSLFQSTSPAAVSMGVTPDRSSCACHDVATCVHVHVHVRTYYLKFTRCALRDFRHEGCGRVA